MAEERDSDEFILEALEEYQRASLDVLDANRGDPEAAVKGLVDLHITWTAADPERARLVSAGRNRVIAGPLGARLKESNAGWMAALRQWLDSERDDGRISGGSIAILHAVVFAPTQEIARLWLSGLLPRDLEDYRRPLAEAAWAGITAAEA
jgi:hypothetical protein